MAQGAWDPPAHLLAHLATFLTTEKREWSICDFHPYRWSPPPPKTRGSAYIYSRLPFLPPDARTSFLRGNDG